MRCAWRQRLRIHLKTMELRGNGETYINRVENEISKIFEGLDKAGLQTHPSKVREREINHVVSMFPPGRFGSQRNAQYHLDLLHGFLKRQGNNIIKEMNPDLDTVTRLAWMPTYEEAEHIWATAQRMGGYERFGVYCALFLGLRRTALIRMETDWYRDGVLFVTSKGRGKGKTRKLSPPDDFEHEWNLVMGERSEEIAWAIENGKGHMVTNHIFLVYCNRNGLSNLKKSAMDRMIKAIGKEAHYPKISWHPLRRRFGRNMYDAGVDLEIVRDILGHKDIDTTRKYIMLDLDDQRGAFDTLKRYRMEKTDESVKQQKLDPISTVNWGR